MPIKKIYFIAPLANVDSTILKMNLNHRFKIKEMPIGDYCKFIAKIERITPEAVQKDLTRNFYTLIDFKRQKVYVIENFIEYKTNKNPILQEKNLGREEQKFINESVQDYLRFTIKKMRLFKEGNICMPFFFIYSLKDNIPNNLMGYSYSISRHISSEKFLINNDQELLKLSEFIKNIKLPFKKSFLQMGFDNFELSYLIQDKNLAFLSLMISLEALLLPNEKGELRYRISRNLAVLLGMKGKYDSNEISPNIRELYDKRSKIVHTGKKNTINDEDLLNLRDYVRESIKMIYELDMGKEELMTLLNSSGFNKKLTD